MSVLQATEVRRLETYRDGLRADLQQAMRIGRQEDDWVRDRVESLERCNVIICRLRRRLANSEE